MAYRGASSIYFNYSTAGGRNQIRFGLRPVNPEAFDSLMLPATNPARWGRTEKIALNRLLYALGYEIHGVLYATLSSSPSGSAYGVNIAPNTPLTRMLKVSQHPALR